MAGERPKKTRSATFYVALGVAVLTPLLMTWPLARNPGHQVLRAMYFWDAYANAMIMGSRVDAAVSLGPLSLYDDYFFAPLPDSIVFNENHFGLSLIFAPVYLLSENPLLAYNWTLLVSLGLSVFFTYLLVRRLTKSALAGILAGVAFAFSPYVFFEMGRIQLVATQWIPLCFYFLHRAFDSKKKSDIFCFWASYVLQIGTCLYYAMFLIPLLGFYCGARVLMKRPERRFVLWFLVGGAAAGTLALLMVYPYFAIRDSFDLERSLAFASSYDGKLSFFSNVSEVNRTLTGLHHRGAFRGAHEEIAFPGLTMTLFTLVGCGVALSRYCTKSSVQAMAGIALRWLALVAVAAFVAARTHSVLVGLVLLVVVGFLLSRRERPRLILGNHGLYLGLLLVAVTMFVGLFPFEYDGRPVKGLYYYFHTYFPGFNGIRKVSRQAVMTTFVVCVLSGWGAAWLFQRLGRRHVRAPVFVLLLAGELFELRAFPHPVEEVWAGTQVPPLLAFVRDLPEDDLVASLPQNRGKPPFLGDGGMALHNYLALYHKHRFVNGQSSWQPPVTDLALHASRNLPDPAARRALLAIGAKHLLLYGDELTRETRHLPARLLAEPEHYQRVFFSDSDMVFSLLGSDDPTLELLPTPSRPDGARLVPSAAMRARAPLSLGRVRAAIDGSPRTFWSGGRPQTQGQYFEVSFDEPREVVALEIENPNRVMDVPGSFELSMSKGTAPLAVVVERPLLQLHRDQVFSPKTFVFRVVLSEPVLADRVRLTVGQGMPGHYFSIHELRVFEQAQGGATD